VGRYTLAYFVKKTFNNIDTRKKEAAPYNYYSDKQYKFISPRNNTYEQAPETKEALKILKSE
jgi:hypothetical protein